MKMRPGNEPPRWIQVLLRRFGNEETLEEVEGDLLEFYSQWTASMGRPRANLKYIVTAIALLRPLGRIYKYLSDTTPFVMIRSYFVMSWRTIARNKVSSLINLSGLTLGLTTSLLILLVVLGEFEYDQFHVKKESIYLVMKNEKTNEGISTGRATAGPMADVLRTDFPEVVHAARVAWFSDVKLLADNKKSKVSGMFADPGIFRMMTFNPIHGDPAKATERNSAVVSASMALRLFGRLDVLGQLIVFDEHNTLEIGAVLEDVPEASSVHFEMAIPFAIYEKTNDWLKKWDDNRIRTWVELADNADLRAFNSKVSLLIQQKTNEPFVTLFAYPLADLHLHGRFSNGQPSGGNIEVVRLLIAFGVFMLLIACVNFMNIATAQSVYRSREVGVRKVLGATRKLIAFQFLNEAFVITFIALFAAIILAILAIPSFNTLTHSSISFDFTKGIVWILSFGVTLLTAIIAGSYPSFVLSRFAPARVLKGMVDLPRGLRFRRVLVAFQFVISISVLVGTIVLYAQFDHIRNRPMGYEQENLVNISLDSLAATKFQYLEEEISALAGVRSVTGMGGNILYFKGAVTGMDWPGKKAGEELSIAVGEVGYNWSATMGVEMVSGRDFDPRFKSDEDGCLLNQAAVDGMGLTDPVGSVVGGHAVVGVFRDYVYNNPSGRIAPMALYLAPSRINHLYVRINNDDKWSETLSAVEQVVKKSSPEIEFRSSFISDEYQSRVNELSDIGLLVSVFGGMTIFISCLGLFGLSGFIAERRSKEMSIRKVFGADYIRVFASLSADVIKPVVIALLIVIPLSAWVAGLVLDNIVYRVPLTWWMFAKATITILTLSLLVVGYHSWRTAKESPATRLKSE